MKQIGQILVERGWVDPAALSRALADQAHVARRICSLLILRGELDPDNAARALSDQHGVPGVLQKHLERRDLTLAGLLPVEFARAQIALPIGRTAGALIVCVRDPRPELHAAIAQVVTGPVVMAVAPAHQLEHLVRETYYTDPARPDAGLVLERGLATPPAALLDPGPPAAPPGDEIDIDVITRQIPVIHDPLDHLGSLTLVGLDDAGVAKDPSQSGQQATALPRTMTGAQSSTSPPAGSRTATAPYTPARTTTPSALPPRPPAGSQPPARGGPRPTAPHVARTMTASHPPPRAVHASHPPPRTVTRSGSTLPLTFRGPALDATTAAIAGAATFDEAIDTTMFYLAGRFHRAVWFTIHEGAALGERGHGDTLTPDMVQALTLPLTAPSIVQIAYDTRRLADTAPGAAGAIQERLTRALGYPHTAAAIPVVVDDRVIAVITVGDPVGDPASAIQDLDRLGQAIARTCRRLAPG